VIDTLTVIVKRGNWVFNQKKHGTFGEFEHDIWYVPEGHKLSGITVWNTYWTAAITLHTDKGDVSPRLGGYLTEMKETYYPIKNEVVGINASIKSAL